MNALLFDPVAFDDNVNNIISNMNTVNFDPVVDNNVTLVKPMRPLTAYHIFFQLEREYIIQTSDGEIANKSSLDNKIYLDDVPERYKNIRLLRDWYAGPGKRKKRKHRKQHGKIGFLELSRIISTRWAELDMVDPETKIFVQKIAKSEIDEYYRDMKQYKELTKDIKEDDDNIITSNVAPKKKSAEKRSRMVSIICHDVNTDNNNNNNNNNYAPSQHVFSGDVAPRRNAEVIQSMDMPSMEIMQLQLQLQSEIDQYLAIIEARKQELLKSHFEAKKAQFEQELVCQEIGPLPFDTIETSSNKKRRFNRRNSMVKQRDNNSVVEPLRAVSTDSQLRGSTSSAGEELEIDDAEILSFWSTAA